MSHSESMSQGGESTNYLEAESSPMDQNEGLERPNSLSLSVEGVLSHDSQSVDTASEAADHDTSFGTMVRSLAMDEGAPDSDILETSVIDAHPADGSPQKPLMYLGSELLDEDLPGPSGISQGSEGLEEDSMKIYMLLALNEAYAESLAALTRNVQLAIAQNKKRQEAINAVLGKTGAIFGNKRKVPVNQFFFPPYFRDRYGMVPPTNAETQMKIISRDYDPLVKAERKWIPKELELLRAAVKRELAEERCLSQRMRRSELAELLKKTGQETTEEERQAWRQEVEDLDRVIDYVKNLSDDEIFGGQWDYTSVDWTKIATFDFMDTRNATQLRLKWINEQAPRWSKAKWTAQEIARLRELTSGPWVRWEMVAKRLGTARTSFQCFQKYKLELEKDTRMFWTKEEDTDLMALCHSMQTNGYIPWLKVSHFMENRSRQQCRVRYERTLDVELKHGRWTEEEDILLRCAVGRFGTKNWKQVASAVPGRTDAQCRDRWVNVLDDNIKDSPWTIQEDEKLLEGVRELGKEWARIALLLPGRSGDHCKTRFRSLMVSKVKICSNLRPEGPLRLNRRHDTTKHRRERREAVEKHFKEMLAGDGQEEVAELLMEEIKKESLSTDDMEALASLPPEERRIIAQMMQDNKTQAEQGTSAPKNLYQLLHEKLNIRPEFLDNATRNNLFRAYERAAFGVTGRRPREVVSGEEKKAFVESLDCLPTEEDKRKFLMDHLVDLMEKSDNADQRFIHQHVPKAHCVYDLAYHLSGELTREVRQVMDRNAVPDRKDKPAALNPLPPCSASLKLLQSIRKMVPTLQSRAGWSFNKVEEGSNAVHVQLSRNVKSCPKYIELKMRLRSLLFWPMLMESAIEPDDVRRERARLRKIKADRSNEEAMWAQLREVEEPSWVNVEVEPGPQLTIRDLFRIRQKGLAPALDEYSPAKYGTNLSHLLRKLGALERAENSLSGGSTLPLRPETERLAMIDECIEAVREKVRNMPLSRFDELLEEVAADRKDV